MNAVDECTNYLACAPQPTSTFRGVVPPDIAPRLGELAATGSVSSPYPLVLAAIAVVVIILAVILIHLGRRSR